LVCEVFVARLLVDLQWFIGVYLTSHRLEETKMKRTMKILLGMAIGLAITACLVLSYMVVRYQSLADEEPEVDLEPSLADILYCSPGGVPQNLDLYFPDTPGPWQILVYVHGGSFTAGDKRKGSGLLDIAVVVEQGFAVAAVNYRLMPDNHFPAGVEDVKCAIRFLRAHAGEYGLKTEQIGIWGGSAGGYYAALSGLTNGTPGYDTGEYLDQSSQVQAVVDMFGPADLSARFDWLQGWLLRRAFGSQADDIEFLNSASPITHVSSDAPPFLIFHGDQDSAVPLSQSQALYDRLAQANVEAQLVVVKNANHNFKPTGGEIQPNRLDISTQMADFFQEKLR
jgi:acetyl esterase/lipase